MDVTIREVSSKKDLKLFVRFPHTIYKDNAYWVPGLLADDEALFDPAKNPAFDSCQARLWLAFRGEEPVGRVAGIINHTYIQKSGNRYARFGWLDYIDDEQVLQLLMQQVEKWAQENKMTAVHGPMGFTDFDSEGLLIEGFEQPGTMSTIYNYAYYPTHLERHGYQKDVDWVEYEVKIPSSTPTRVRDFALLAARRYGLSVLQVKKSSELLPYARSVFELINVAYAHLYGVVPLSDKQIDTYLKQYFSFIKTDFVSFILKDNKLVAFAIAMPSLSDALRKAKGRLFPFGFIHLYRALNRNTIADLFLIAVHPSLQQKGVSAMIMHDLCEKMIRNGIQKAITHPMLEENGNVLNIWKNFDRTIVRKRRCYFKAL